MWPVLLTLLLGMPAPEPGVPHHHAGYRLGIQELDADLDVLTVASTVEGGARITDWLGVGAVFPFVYVGPDFVAEFFDASAGWVIGNPAVSGTYYHKLDRLGLAATLQLGFPAARLPDEAVQRRIERNGLASAAIRSGGWDLWMWTPEAFSVVGTVRIDQPFGILNLGLDAGAFGIFADRSRPGLRIGGDASLRPWAPLEIGVRFQTTGVLEGRFIFVTCEPPPPPPPDGEPQPVQPPCRGSGPGDRVHNVFDARAAHFSIAPWLATHVADLFTASARLTINLSPGFGPNDQADGLLWGFDLFAGVFF